MGADPQLPAAQNFLVPPMQVPTGVGWQGDAPSRRSASGLKIEKIAGGLMHPRQLLALPNGDVLVVESNGPGDEAVTTPKQLIAGIVKNRSGKGDKGGNRITLLRKAGGARARWEAARLPRAPAFAVRRPADRATRCTSPTPTRS